MKTKDLKTEYRKFVATLKDVKLGTSITYDLISEVYVSEWAKIYLIGNVESEEVEIQVELSIPISSQEESNSSKVKCDMGFFLRAQIEQLEFLLRLHVENKFKIDLIREEGIWYGTKKLLTEPTDELISQLMPPVMSPEKLNMKSKKTK